MLLKAFYYVKHFKLPLLLGDDEKLHELICINQKPFVSAIILLIDIF